MIKEPEDEAFEDIERKQKEAEAEGWRKRQITRVKSVEDAFADWEHSHRPDAYNIELRAFKAGWVAGVRNEWAKERND